MSPSEGRSAGEMPDARVSCARKLATFLTGDRGMEHAFHDVGDSESPHDGHRA